MTVITRSGINVGQLPSKGDLALAGSLLGVAVLSGFYVDANRPDTIEPSSPWHWLLIACPPILVAVRRLNPIVVTVLATMAQVGIWVSGLPEVLLSIVVILYAAASDTEGPGLRVAIGSSVVLVIVTGVGVQIADDVTLYQLPLIALTCGTAIVLGVNATRQRQVAARLAASVAESRMRSEHQRAQAVAEERSHIARELHDIIGHTLAVIAVRAEAADRVAQNKPQAATDAVSAIARAARSALTETRTVLAGLRDSTAVDLAPPPDLDATRKLVADLREAGVDATLSEEGCTDDEPPAVVAGGAYRIVQESITNALKHGGPGVAVEVVLVCGPSWLEIRVTNDVDPTVGSGPTGVPSTGITSMVERATVLGGTFEAGRDGTRFVVEAKLPTDAERVGATGP